MAEHITSITSVSWEIQMREHRLEVKMLQHERLSGNILVLVEKQGEEERRAGRGTSASMSQLGTHLYLFHAQQVNQCNDYFSEPPDSEDSEAERSERRQYNRSVFTSTAYQLRFI